MPECVKTYRDSLSMLATFKVQSEILESYRDDFSKYTPHMNRICLDAVFLNVAKSVGKQLKYTRLSDGHSGQMNRKAFDLLVKARVLQKIPSCDPSGLPLGVSRSTINDGEFFTLCDVCTKPLRPQTPRLRLRYVGFKGIGDALA